MIQASCTTRDVRLLQWRIGVAALLKSAARGLVCVSMWGSNLRQQSSWAWLQNSPTCPQRPIKYCSLIIIHLEFTSKKSDYNKLYLAPNYTEYLGSLWTSTIIAWFCQNLHSGVWWGTALGDMLCHAQLGSRECLFIILEQSTRGTVQRGCHKKVLYKWQDFFSL